MTQFIVPTVTQTLSHIKTLWNQIDNYKTSENSNKISTSSIMLLDPMTTMLRLAILKFKQRSTKIGVANHKLTFYEPVIYQGIVRWWYGDSRIDIQYLYLPILYFACIRHNYVKTHFDEYEEKRQIFDKINILALDGLKILRSIYNQNDTRTDIITNCIDSYIHILSVSNDKSDFIQQKYEDMQNTIRLIYQEFSKEWSERYVQIILNLISELETIRIDTFKTNISVTIESMLNNMDQIIDKIRS